MQVSCKKTQSSKFDTTTHSTTNSNSTSTSTSKYYSHSQTVCSMLKGKAFYLFLTHHAYYYYTLQQNRIAYIKPQKHSLLTLPEITKLHAFCKSNHNTHIYIYIYSKIIITKLIFKINIYIYIHTHTHTPC
jgi:hypothetical protein